MKKIFFFGLFLIGIAFIQFSNAIDFGNDLSLLDQVETVDNDCLEASFAYLPVLTEENSTFSDCDVIFVNFSDYQPIPIELRNKGPDNS